MVWLLETITHSFLGFHIRTSSLITAFIHPGNYVHTCQYCTPLAQCHFRPTSPNFVTNPPARNSRGKTNCQCKVKLLFIWIRIVKYLASRSLKETARKAPLNMRSLLYFEVSPVFFSSNIHAKFRKVCAIKISISATENKIFEMSREEKFETFFLILPSYS